MDSGNYLLDRLPAEVLKRLMPDLVEVQIERHQVVHHPGEEILDLYFPVTCMISVTVTMQDGKTVEAGAVGSREVVGINAFMGGAETTQTEYVGQVAGKAWKIAAAPLKEEFDRNSELRSVLLKYTQAMIAQISQNTACNRLHEVDERCSRWLLDVRDRVRSDTLALTHEFIGEMLGANRTTVSLAMSELQNKGLIEYTRGHIKLLNVPELERISCECYSVLQTEYERLLGNMRPAIITS